MAVDVVLKMLAGLGLFLYGMKLMSDGLEKVAGAKLRSILEVFTKNQFIGMLVGIIFTAIVQSSSATTVLIVSFVNAGLMNLYQAAGVILGANIGTTVTTQLIAFNLSEIAPVFLMAGVCLVMFTKKPTLKKIGEVVLGFGVLFFGMSVMSDAMETLKQSQTVMDLISSLNSPMIALLVGFLVTAVLQSSSATVGIVLLLASQGFLSLWISFFIILGCNMGSCVSAVLASIGAKKNAKRAALIHFIVNIVGSMVIVIVLFAFGNHVEAFIRGISSGMSEELVNGANLRTARDVANAHLIFKVFQVIIMFPFTKLVVKLTYWIVKGEEEKVDEKHLKYIGDSTVYSATSALPQTVLEIERMGNIAFENLNRATTALLSKDDKIIEQVYETENTINFMSTEITSYLVRVNQLELPIDDRKMLAGLFHVVSDIERIGDHAENIADFTKIVIDSDLAFSSSAEDEIKTMLDKINCLLTYAMDMFRNKNEEHLKEILQLENEIDELERQYQRKHVTRLTRSECNEYAGMIFSDLLSNLERVADHGTNIAFSILEEDPEHKDCLA